MRIDNEAMRIAILAELARQGVEFAQVFMRPFSKDEIHPVILLHTEAQLRPESVNTCRVIRQLAEAGAAARAKAGDHDSQ